MAYFDNTKNILDEFETDIERATYLQNILIDYSTGKNVLDVDYIKIRNWVTSKPEFKIYVPQFVKTCRSLNQFWQFIKFKYDTYHERRVYIYSEFEALLSYIEERNLTPADKSISDILTVFSEDNVHAVWQKALNRRNDDPDGAITMARTLLETVCKNILDAQGIEYKVNVELSELYKITAEYLNLSAGQHTEVTFKQILGGCSGVINGLGSLRNKLGDAHGYGKSKLKPAPRHAELAVNLSGAMALFLVSTWLQNKK